MSVKDIAAVLALLALFGVVGAMAAKDAQVEQAHYCEMVKAGHWPDYRGAYRHECRSPISGPR